MFIGAGLGDSGYSPDEEAQRMILGYGGAIEVLEPLALCRSVQDFESQTIAKY
jgi:predicted DNA-binding transcriptional regulator YafY